MRFVRGGVATPEQLLPRRHTSVVNRLDVVITRCRCRGSRASKMERDESDFIECLRATRFHELDLYRPNLFVSRIFNGALIVY